MTAGRRSAARSITCLLLTLFLAAGSLPLSACDSTILELLTGTNAQQSITTRILAVSQKIQQSASLLKSFNHAAASNLHREVMENWLYIAAQITATPPVAAENAAEFSDLLIEIARDLGQVRRKLDGNQSDFIHEILEACITRMSLVSALINDNPKVKEFLQIELMIYCLRPFFADLTTLTRMTAESGIAAKLTGLRPRLSPQAADLASEIVAGFDNYRISLQKDQEVVSIATQQLFQGMLNSFIRFKQHLLNESYFKKL